MVDSRFDWGVTRVTPGQFRSQIEFALKDNFRFYTLTEYLDNSDFHQNRVAITFDDGYESVYQNAYPILKKYNIPATVFVNPNYLGRLNTWDVNIGGLKFRHMERRQLTELSEAGWEVGSHTMNHCDLTCLSRQAAEKELSDSLDFLKKNIKNFNYFLAYPFGNTNKKVINLCKSLGYRGGVLMGNGYKGLPEAFTIPRIGMYLLDTLYSFRQKLYVQNMRLYYNIQKILNICSNCTVLVKKNSWS
ncbi:polysaccharide deacetylase family protein [candidate division KSB1 bacterium]|nr:polysaccharide deacetylase family protein [candidate division KSB1 bacterium]